MKTLNFWFIFNWSETGRKLVAGFVSDWSERVVGNPLPPCGRERGFSDHTNTDLLVDNHLSEVSDHLPEIRRRGKMDKAGERTEQAGSVGKAWAVGWGEAGWNGI